MERGNCSSESITRYPLDSIYFYLTEGCNLRCRHCWIEPKFQTEKRQHAVLDTGLFRDVIGQAKPLGLAMVKLTGGEPFLHPRIGEIIDIIRDEDLRLVIETNGVLCTPELAAKVAACKGAFVSVSLDGADAATHEWVRGVDGCFDASLDGIRNLVRSGIRPQVIMSVMRRNVGQVEAVVRLAGSIGASSVKFNLVQPTARGVKMHEEGETLSVSELLELGTWVENDLSPRAGIALHSPQPAAFRPLGRMYGSDGSGCSACGIFSIIGVLADGSYALCGIGETVPEMVFGHAAKDRLEDVWNGTPVLRDIREGLPKRLTGVCGECVMKGVCLGSCIAQNYSRGKDLWAPFWFCEEAKRAGLFPETRRKSRPVRTNEERQRDGAGTKHSAAVTG